MRHYEATYEGKTLAIVAKTIEGAQKIAVSHWNVKATDVSKIAIVSTTDQKKFKR